jgi:hypothetical protein
MKKFFAWTGIVGGLAGSTISTFLLGLLGFAGGNLAKGTAYPILLGVFLMLVLFCNLLHFSLKYIENNSKQNKSIDSNNFIEKILPRPVRFIILFLLLPFLIVLIKPLFSDI